MEFYDSFSLSLFLPPLYFVLQVTCLVTYAWFLAVFKIKQFRYSITRPHYSHLSYTKSWLSWLPIVFVSVLSGRVEMLFGSSHISLPLRFRRSWKLLFVCYSLSIATSRSMQNCYCLFDVWVCCYIRRYIVRGLLWLFLVVGHALSWKRKQNHGINYQSSDSLWY